MAEKKTGISSDFIIHPGETIADILKERNITQKELAIQTGVTPSFISNIINGKKDISKEFAMSLEYALDIPKSFWLNLQAQYEAEMLEFKEESSVTEEELRISRKLKDVANYLGIPKKRSKPTVVISLRKALRISNLSSLCLLPAITALKKTETGKIDPYILGACVMLYQIRKEKKIKTDSDIKEVNRLVSELRSAPKINTHAAKTI